jgi:hypothetical protein
MELGPCWYCGQPKQAFYGMPGYLNPVGHHTCYELATLAYKRRSHRGEAKHTRYPRRVSHGGNRP